MKSISLFVAGAPLFVGESPSMTRSALSSTPAPPPDPVAGVTFLSRTQTRYGNNTPLGLFQDGTCTIPAVNDGDPIAAFKDMLSGSNTFWEQTDTQKQPILLFESGVPTILFDGVDDCLALSSVSVLGNTIVASFGNLSNSLGYNGLIVGKDSSGVVDTTFLAALPGTGPAAASDDQTTTVPLSTWNSVSALFNNTQAVINSGSGDATVTNTYSEAAADITVGDRSGGGREVSLQLTGIFIFADSTQAGLVRSYAATLNPA